VTGYVPDTTPYLDAAWVSIAPLRYGAGMKGKVGEAMAAGLPVVTTSIGAEGVELKDGITALVADTPEAFADAVRRLCTDDALHQGISARARSRALRPAGRGRAPGGRREARYHAPAATDGTRRAGGVSRASGEAEACAAA